MGTDLYVAPVKSGNAGHSISCKKIKNKLFKPINCRRMLGIVQPLIFLTGIKLRNYFISCKIGNFEQNG